MIILVHVHRTTAEIRACLTHVLIFAHTKVGGIFILTTVTSTRSSPFLKVATRRDRCYPVKTPTDPDEDQDFSFY